MLPIHELPDRLETERFVLRSWLPGDGPALREALLPSYAHLEPWMPWADPDPEPDELAMRVRTFRADWLTGTNFVVAVFDPTETRVLGGTGFHTRDSPYARGDAEVGMWIAAPEAGKGLGQAVLRSMLDWGFGTWGWRRLEWRCDAENTPSMRVAERCGLVHEATLRGCWRHKTRGDVEVFALTADQWRS